MCSPTKCSSCGKQSFVGCGKHLSMIFSGKKESELCKCNPKIVQWIKDNLKK